MTHQNWKAISALLTLDEHAAFNALAQRRGKSATKLMTEMARQQLHIDSWTKTAIQTGKVSA